MPRKDLPRILHPVIPFDHRLREVADLAGAAQVGGAQVAEAIQVLNKDETPSWRELKDILLKRMDEQGQAVATAKAEVAAQASRSLDEIVQPRVAAASEPPAARPAGSCRRPPCGSTSAPRRDCAAV